MILSAAALLLAVPLQRAMADATGAMSGGAGSTANVAIDNYTFKPYKITIAPGTTVVWTNKDDDPHTVTADNGAFDSKGMGQGDTFKHTFDTAGNYTYHCSAHPYMKAVVVVQGGTQ